MRSYRALALAEHQRRRQEGTAGTSGLLSDDAECHLAPRLPPPRLMDKSRLAALGRVTGAE